MDGSESDDELKELRAGLVARRGASGLTVSALRAKSAASRPPPPASARPEVELEDNADDMELAAQQAAMMMPMSFGKQSKASKVPRPSAAAPSLDEDLPTIEEAHPSSQALADNGLEASAAADDDGMEAGIDTSGRDPDSNDATDDLKLPISHQVSLQAQGKIVTAIDVDHSGSRVLVGSRDYSLRLFDFNGMKSTMQSFRSLEPSDGHPVHALSWSPSGDAFLVVTGSAKIKIYDRDGRELGESLQGDMYIRDMKNTKGHVSPCLNGQWHPHNKGSAITSSEDGTVRVWDTEELAQAAVIKPTLSKPGRVGVTSCRYSPDGLSIAGGLADGSIHIWDVRGKYGSSASVGQVLPPKAQMLGKQDWRFLSGSGKVVRVAHQPNQEISCLCYADNGIMLASRSCDETLKTWDLRKLKQPTQVFNDLPAHIATTQVCFSPDQKLVLTGISATPKQPTGALVFLDIATQRLVRRVALPGSVAAVTWHERLNQIFVGTGDAKKGAAHVLYSPASSFRGALLCANRLPRSQDPVDFEAPLVIHTPHALPMFREDKLKRSRHLDDRTRVAKAMRPDPGPAASSGPGKGGLIGTTGGTLLTQYILKNQGKLDVKSNNDVRASILRHGDKSDTFTKFTDAYAKTQPERIFQQEEKDEEEDQ